MKYLNPFSKDTKEVNREKSKLEEDRGKETTRNIFYCTIDANFKNCIEKILFESQKKMEYLYKYFNPFFKDTKEVNREKSKQLFKENFSLSINNVYHNYVSLKIKYKI